MAFHVAKKRKSNRKQIPQATSAELTNSPPLNHEDNNLQSSNGSFASQSRFAGGDQARPRSTSSLDAGANSMSMAQMQVSELLEAVRPNPQTRLSNADDMLRKIKNAIENIKPEGPFSAFEAQDKLRTNFDVTIPFPEQRLAQEAQYKFAFAKPTYVNLIGSAVLNTTHQHEKTFTVDMAVTMPPEILQPKDYLHFRYFNKRAFYLAVIAARIVADEEIPFDVCWSFQNGNLLQPVALLSPARDTKNKLQSSFYDVRILVGPPQGYFPSQRLLPYSNCARNFRTVNPKFGEADATTPLYNGTLLSESNTEYYLDLFTSSSSKYPGFGDACVLTSIWLRQRGFGTAIQAGGFGSFESATILALLLKSQGKEGSPMIFSGFGGYDLFKIVLQFLSKKDLIKDPLILGAGVANKEMMLKLQTPMAYDGGCAHNVLFKMTPWSYAQLRHEARTTVSLLSQATVDPLTLCFISKVDNPILQFDQFFRITAPNVWKDSLVETGYCGTNLAFCKELVDLLVQALGNRVNTIHLIYPSLKSRSLASSIIAEERPTIVVAFRENMEHSLRKTDLGPHVEDKKSATAFRNFWGRKAELRRFKDGSITECLTWSTASEDSPIVHQIIEYAVERHLGSEVAKTIEFVKSSIMSSLPSPHRSLIHSLESFKAVWSNFEELQNNIMGLKSLPLPIRQLSASCTELRSASVYLRGTSNMIIQPQAIDIVVQFEASARWPDNLAAIQRTKIAFLAKLGELIEVQNPSYKTRVGIENEYEPMANGSYLDVTTKLLTFRLRIFHDREATLLSHQLQNKTTSGYSREMAAIAIFQHERTFVHAPIHTQIIRNLCSKFTLLSPTIRLLKYWCFAHLLKPHFSEELLELLAVHTFISPFPYSPPGSLRTAFLRTLYFIAKWDWRLEPLILDLRGDLTASDVEAIRKRFAGWRRIDPAMNRMTLFVASNFNPEGTAWTLKAPSIVAAARLTALARGSCNLFGVGDLRLDEANLFLTNLGDYDFLIHLEPALYQVPGIGAKATHSMAHNTTLERPHTFNILVSFLDDLKRVHGSNIVLFHNDGVRPVIGGLWNPKVESGPWRSNINYSAIPVSDDHESSRLAINKEGILTDIARLGGDLISRIRIKGRDW